MIFWVSTTLLGSILFGMGYSLWSLQRVVQTSIIEKRILQHTLHQIREQCAEQLTQLQHIQEEKALLHTEINQLQSTLAVSQERLQQQLIWRERHDDLQQTLKAQQNKNAEQQAKLHEVTVRLEETQRTAEQQQQFLMNSEQRLVMQFENLAHRIFDQSGRKVDEQGRQRLEQLLFPLREQLEGFRKQVQENFHQETRERHTLVHEIQRLQQLNVQMAKDTVNLTRALKGNHRVQGSWGEIVLTRLLQAAGLREGHEYQTQVSFTTDQARRLQPDVIVHLPQGKAVIVDAKMSLSAYERYFNSASQELENIERAQALKEHLASIRNHIRLLAEKEYHKVLGLGALDYILMFIPIEPAFLLALDQAPDLLHEALAHHIMLVSPTTLLVALKTIANLWRYEYQSQNSEKIAENAARLYDKLRLFLEEMEQLGKSLMRAQESYQQAWNKLAQGRGNLIRQAEQFRQLGVAVKRPLSSALSLQESQILLNKEETMQNSGKT